MRRTFENEGLRLNNKEYSVVNFGRDDSPFFYYHLEIISTCLIGFPILYLAKVELHQMLDIFIQLFGFSVLFTQFRQHTFTRHGNVGQVALHEATDGRGGEVQS